MGRAPCCEKMGLKKGPWTPEEDQILINYIQLYGHGNWRALPKQAGLLRCGKSCRLRWTNYLRPDIKRGNFSREEEETIINLHDMLGNRWSAIAARLPGRTDNEIKNVWHTHLKKRLNQNQSSQDSKRHRMDTSKLAQNSETKPESVPVKRSESSGYVAVSPQESYSDTSSSITTSCTDNNTNSSNNNNNDGGCNKVVGLLEYSPEMDESFWSEVLSAENSGMESDFPAVDDQFPFSPISNMEPFHGYSSNNLGDGMEFWFNLFTRAGEFPELS